MTDEQLRDHVLQRADDDDELSDQARLVVLAAWRNLPAGDPLTVAMSRLDAEVQTLARQQAAALTAPDVDDVERACAALRSAAGAQADAERAADALSADRVQFLETSLEFHDRHGTQPCPVCAKGTLDDEWVARARAALAAEQEAASALRVARSGAHRARQALTTLVREVDPPPAEDAGLTEIVAARVAYQSFSTLPVDDDTALVDRVARDLPELRTAYDALREAAAPKLAIAHEAQKWLQALAPTLER
ncbi:MAG: hypothetical protein ACREEG_12660 [Phenylobacterium sp.]